MKNTIIYLLGFPGVGKYTIAKEIAKQPDFRLVDNHLINIPLFTLVNADGKTPLPQRMWDNVGTIWSAVLDTMIHISPAHLNFVLTNALGDIPEDHGHFKNIEAMATARKANFVPARLLCSVAENEKRIVQPDRKTRMKEINPKSPAANAAKTEVIKVNPPNTLTLDVTNLSPSQAAEQILNHARALR